MKVRLQTSLSGPGQTWQAGEPYECSTETGWRLIDRKMAEPIGKPPPRPTLPAEQKSEAPEPDPAEVETATAGPAETAVAPAQKRARQTKG